MGSPRSVIISTALSLWFAPALGFAQQSEAPVSMFTASKGSTADHGEFEVLQKEFKSGEEVTEACLSCHTEASDQVMHSIHYNWDYKHPETGQTLGKRTSSTRSADRLWAMSRAAPRATLDTAGTV